MSKVVEEIKEGCLWNDAEKLKPMHLANVLLGSPDTEVLIGYYSELSDAWYEHNHAELFEPPTHWMELPEPPEAK